MKAIISEAWRRDWDSNPGTAFAIDGFQDRCNKPSSAIPPGTLCRNRTHIMAVETPYSIHLTKRVYGWPGGTRTHSHSVNGRTLRLWATGQYLEIPLRFALRISGVAAHYFTKEPNGTSARIWTQIDGFGDRSPTIERHWYKIKRRW